MNTIPRKHPKGLVNSSIFMVLYSLPFLAYAFIVSVSLLRTGGGFMLTFLVSGRAEEAFPYGTQPFLTAGLRLFFFAGFFIMAAGLLGLKGWPCKTLLWVQFCLGLVCFLPCVLICFFIFNEIGYIDSFLPFFILFCSLLPPLLYMLFVVKALRHYRF